MSQGAWAKWATGTHISFHKEQYQTMRGISRAESKRSKGWLVRVYSNGKTYSKFFSYLKYGGKLKSLRRAQEELRLMEKTYPSTPRSPFRTTPLSRSKTGINGVCLTFGRNRYSGTKMPCYSVHYRLGGQVFNKRFYISQYDDSFEALKEATTFRREMEKEMMREWQQKQRAERLQKHKEREARRARQMARRAAR